MRLEFEDSNGEKKVIGEPQNSKETWILMHEFLKQQGFKSYYTRMSLFTEERKIWIDYGSHVSFFWVTDMTDENIKEFIGGSA